MKWIDRHQRIHLFQMMDLATATCWLSRNWKRMKAWALSLSFSFIWANSRGSKIPFFNWGLWAPIEDCWLRQVPNQEASDQGLIDFSFHHLIAIKWRDEKKSILNPWFEDLLILRPWIHDLHLFLFTIFYYYFSNNNKEKIVFKKEKVIWSWIFNLLLLTSSFVFFSWNQMHLIEKKTKRRCAERRLVIL